MIPFWWRVLHGRADLHEQVEPVLDAQPAGVAVFGQRPALDQLHDEIGPAGSDAAGLVRVVPPSRILAMLGWSISAMLPLGLEPRQDGLGVHPRLDQLEGHQPLDRLCAARPSRRCPCRPRRSARAACSGRRRSHRPARRPARGDCRPRRVGSIARRIEDVVGLGVGPEQGLDATPQPLVAGAGLGEEGGALGLGRLVQGGDEDRGFGHDPGPFRVEAPAVAPSVNAPSAGGKHHVQPLFSRPLARHPRTRARTERIFGADRGAAPPRIRLLES